VFAMAREHKEMNRDKDDVEEEVKEVKEKEFVNKDMIQKI